MTTARIAADIRTAHATFGTERVRLADLREKVGATRAGFDAAIAQLALETDAHVRAEADQKTLTQRDRDGGVMLGGTVRHDLYIAPSVDPEDARSARWFLTGAGYRDADTAEIIDAMFIDRVRLTGPGMRAWLREFGACWPREF